MNRLAALVLTSMMAFSVPQTHTKITIKDHTQSINEKRLKSLFHLILDPLPKPVCQPKELIVDIYPYKIFENMIKARLKPEYRAGLIGTGLLVFATTNLSDKFKPIIYAYPNSVDNDEIMMHEIFHHIVAHCLGFGIPHSENVPDVLAHNFQLTKKYKDWLKNRPWEDSE